MPLFLEAEIIPTNFAWYNFIFLFLFFVFYNISTFVGYLIPNPFYTNKVLFHVIQFSISTRFNCQKHFYFKLFSLVKQLYFKQFWIV